MGVSVSNLSEEHKKKLENLVTGLYEGGEDEEVIRAFVDEYKTKYGQKSVDQQRRDFAEAVKPKQGILQQTNEQKRLLPRLSKEQEQQQKDMLASPELAERARQNNILKAKKREEYAKSLDARSKNLSKALETSDDAIVKEISERKLNQSNTDFLSNEDVLKSDATAVQGMGYTPQLKDNQVLQSEIDSFKQTASQDPTAQRAALATIARRDPKKSAEIKADIYAIDAAQLRNAHDDDNRAATVADNIEKIKSGEFDYDINSGALIKKESFLQSLATGARERGKQLDLFDKLNNATDEEAQKIIETLDSDIDPDYNPIPVGSELGSALGMESVPMAITTAAGLVTKNPYVGAALVAPEYYRRSYVGGFIETYKALVDQGMNKNEAIQKAREQADQEGLLGAAEGAVSSLVGGRIGLRELPKVNLTGGFKGAVNQLIKESGHFVGETTLDGLTDGVVSGGLQYAKNYLAIDKGVDKSIDDQVYENVKGELMFSFATGAVMKSMSGAMNLSGKVVNKLSYYLAKQDPATVQSFSDQMVEEGKATPEEAEAFKKEIDRTRVIDSKVPEDIQESSKVKIVENIKKREDLEKKLETTDKAYHPQIKEDIKAINEKILELSNNKKSEDVQEEKEKVLKPEVIDDVTPQQQPAQEQQQETTHPEIAQPETQPETQQDAKPDATKQKQDFELELDELFPEVEALAKKAEGMSPEEISKSMDLLGKGGDSVTLQDLGITKEDGTKDIITKLSKLDTPLKPILEFMSKDKDFKNQKVDWYDGTNQTHDKIFKYFGIQPQDFAGLYFEKSTFGNHHVAGEMAGRVLYNPSAVQNHFATIVHEILHNYTLESGKIDGFINTLKKGGRLSELEDIYNYIAEKKGKDNSDRYDPAKYGTKNFKEFIVELMISPQLREYVGDVVASRSEVKEARPKIKTDFIDKLRRIFIEFVQDLFNRSKQEYNGPLVDEAIKALEDLFFGGNQVIDRSGMKWSSQSSGNQGMDFALAMPSKSEKDSIVNKAKSDGTFMKAPNGKKTKLTEDQWVTVRTKAFKDWFGDWENDPQNASKVVDENGEPMVVYHGTNASFDIFRGDMQFFAEDKQFSKEYGKNVMPIFLNIKKPFDLSNKSDFQALIENIGSITDPYDNEQYSDYYEYGNNTNGFGDTWWVTENYKTDIESIGYDGSIITEGGSNKNYVTFSPNQIKSATSNNGNFSKEDNSILAMPSKRETVKINGVDLPVKDVMPDVVNGFYSPLEKTILNTKYDKLPVKQWIDKFANGEEAKWTGLNGWLKKQEGSISKSDILNFLKNNRIEIKEVVLGGNELSGKWEKMKNGGIKRKIGNRWSFVYDLGDGTFTAQGPSGFTRRFNSLEDAKAHIDNQSNASSIKPTKFQEYQLPGGKNYKEILVTIPNKNGKSYVSPHYNDENIVVHLRMNTRTDENGDTVLFLEEIQSDWGQEGRKKGFATGERVGNFESYIKSLGLDWSEQRIRQEFRDKSGNEYKNWNRIQSQQYNVSSAPYVTNTNAWVKLGLEVALKEAVNQGADRIAWATGDQQNDRYNLANVISKITAKQEWTAASDGSPMYTIESKYKTGEETSGSYRAEELSDIVGKDLANKIISDGGGTYIGLDLQVGSKGMKAFYGDAKNIGIIGNVAKSLFKQNVESSIINGNEQPSIYLSDQNKKQVESGLPLFMKAKSSLSEKNRQDVTNWINKFKDKYSQEQLAAALESKGIDPKEFFDIQKEQGKKALATRAVEGDAPGTTKELLAQRGLDYEVESHSQANEQAEAIIDYLGVDRALQAVRASDIDGAQASFVWAKAIDKIGEEIESEKNLAEIQKLSERQADLLSEYDEMMRTAGRKISALQAVYKMSKLGYKFYIQKQVARLNNEAFSEQDRKQIRELEKKLANVNAQVANLMASNQDLINKLNDKLNKKTLPAEKEARKKELAKKIGDKVRAILNRGPLFMPSKSNPQVDMLMADPEVVEFLNLTYEGSNGSSGFKSQLKSVSPELGSLADAIFVRLGGQFDDSGTSEKSVNNAIKNFFGENPAKKMLEIAREYYIEGDIIKGSLVKYLSEKSGLSEGELDEYASQIEARFDDMHSKRVRSEIERIYPRNKMAKKKGKKDYEKMIEAINVGLKTGQRKDGSPFNFVDEFKNKFGFIDNNDPDVRQKIDNFAAKIYNSKGNTLYHAMAVTEMLDWMANNGKENKIVAGLVEQVYANMLYGPDTHFRNTNFNVQKLVSAMITQSLQAKYNKQSAGVVLKELFKGLQRGMLEARNAIRTGDTKAGETPQAKKFSERMAENGNWWGAYASVPSRMLSAMDSAISFPLRQSRMAFILQQELAKQNPGLSKAEIVKMVSEAIDGTTEQVAEWKKRSEEDTMKFYGLDEPMFIDGKRNPAYTSSKYNEAYRNYNRSYYQMKEDAFLDRSVFDEAKDYADTQLLMSKPKGWFGAGASFVNMIGQMNPLLKVLTSPFVNVPFNIAAHMWEFSPMGYITAMSGKEGAGLGEDFAKRLGIQTEITPRRKRDLLWKATSGTLGMAAVALLTQLEYDDDDEGKRRPVLIVTADGLGNSENSKISGLSGSDQFQEYTIDFMGQRFSYKYSPFAAWFLPIGYMMDEERYGQYGNRTEKPNMELFAKSVAGYMLFMKDQSSLKGVTDLLNIGTEQKTYGKEVPLSQKVADGVKKSGAGFIRNLVIPNAIPQFYRHYKGFMDMQESSGVSFTDRLVKDIPFFDQFADKKYDHFGKPIDSRWKIPGIYDERPSGNVLYDLARDKAYIDNLKYFRDNRVVDYNGVEHPLTDDQTNAISKRLAEIAGEEFERRYSNLQNMSPDVFKKQANKIFKRSLDKAASEVLGLPINVRGRFMSRDPETAKDLENVPEE